MVPSPDPPCQSLARVSYRERTERTGERETSCDKRSARRRVPRASNDEGLNVPNFRPVGPERRGRVRRLRCTPERLGALPSPFSLSIPLSLRGKDYESPRFPRIIRTSMGVKSLLATSLARHSSVIRSSRSLPCARVSVSSSNLLSTAPFPATFRSFLALPSARLTAKGRTSRIRRREERRRSLKDQQEKERR